MAIAGVGSETGAGDEVPPLAPLNLSTWGLIIASIGNNGNDDASSWRAALVSDDAPGYQHVVRTVVHSSPAASELRNLW